MLILSLALVHCSRGNPRNSSHFSDPPFQEFAQDVDDRVQLVSADDLPLHDRDPRGLADVQVALDLLPLQGLLLLRPLQPRHRLLYSAFVFIYTHFVYKAIHGAEIVRAYRAEFNFVMFIVCSVLYVEFVDRFGIR